MTRAATLTLAALLALPVWAKTVWVVGRGAPVDAPAVAQALGAMLGEEVALVEDLPSLIAWAEAPDAPARATAVAADRLLVTLPPAESAGLALLALDALASERPAASPPPILVAVQKPVYKMAGLCDDDALQRAAALADAAGMDYVALPKVWQQVYTDDTFYDGRVPQGARAEAHILAAGLLLALRGADAAIPPLAGIHPAVDADLADSVRKGYALTASVRYAAARRPAPEAYPIRVGNAFGAVLYDGAFEHAIGDWLLRLAKADGRDLTLHYTTDTSLRTGLPALFRTTAAPTAMPEASLYTRPAFDDDSGREELAHLPQILAADAAKPGWMPFPLALARLARRLPDTPLYDGPRPTAPTAAMCAAMLYLKWTGAAVLPPDCDQFETAAIDVGLDVMLRLRLLRGDANAIFCRPLGDGRYAFSLWRRPGHTVTLRLSPGAEPDTLTFKPRTFWQRQTVTAPLGSTLHWKAQPAFPGQTLGARETR